MGLSISRSIARAHDGQLAWRADDEGVTFTLVLPIIVALPAHDADPAASELSG
jgi:signal transduction histidine kinase